MRIFIILRYAKCKNNCEKDKFNNRLNLGTVKILLAGDSKIDDMTVLFLNFRF